MLRARYLWLDAGRVHAPGELVVGADGRVLAARPLRGRVVRTAAHTIADVALVPGLVDAHAHLQIAPLADAERGERDALVRESFVGWIGAVLGARAGTRPAAFDVHAREGLAARARGGATAVGEIDSTGRTVRAVRRWPGAIRCYREVTGFDLLDDDAAARRLARLATPSEGARRFVGFSPHAPYSTSAALIRAACRRRAVQIHVAETPEEVELLHTGRGPMRELLERLGRWPADWRAPGVGPIAWLERIGVLGPGRARRTTLVHCQQIETDDVPTMARSGAPIVVCPGTIRWFGRRPPDVVGWRAAGIPVALGTDSRASNDDASMVTAMALARAAWPGLSATDTLEMATQAGAAALALDQPHASGTLAPGAFADYCVLPLAARAERSAEDVLDAFTHGALRPAEVYAADVPVAMPEPVLVGVSARS